MIRAQLEAAWPGLVWLTVVLILAAVLLLAACTPGSTAPGGY
jgi:hypothetical protein